MKKKPLILYNGTASTTSRGIPSEKDILNNLLKIKWVKVRKIKKEASVLDLCSLIKKADLVISVDTGITHIASAFNVPTIVHKSDENVFSKSSITIENSFYDNNLYRIVEDILIYVYAIPA